MKRHLFVGVMCVAATIAGAVRWDPAPLVFAQGQNRPAQQHHAGDWLRRYKDVPPQDQQKALNSDPQFRKLPPDQSRSACTLAGMIRGITDDDSRQQCPPEIQEP